MRFSFCGTGFIFPTHLKAIQEVGGEIVGLNTNEDCVSILTPNHLHYEHIRKYQDKKYVLCEKPLTINAKQCRELPDNVYTVMQLRYHPLLKEIEVKDFNEIEMDISVYRDDKYHNGWKGNVKKSGGIIFNLGIHYFDILFQLFGKPTSASCEIIGRVAQGVIKGDKYNCIFRLSTDEKLGNQRRVFKVNGKEYNFSAKENLAYENLHKYVYQDLINGNGVKAKDVAWLISFIEKLSSPQ